jgi:glycerol-3-phosphate dehydrogenase
VRPDRPRLARGEGGPVATIMPEPVPDCEFDVAIVGGGIIGAGIARDAALRGLRVALFDRHDLGSGTTAGSTRLIHGGLRYLATADFRLVRLDLRERETLLRIAPHLVAPLPFLLPLPRRRRLARWRLRTGMLLYDALSFDKTLPSHRVVEAAELGRLEPLLSPEQFTGAALFYDAQVYSPERLTLENAIDASEHGARIETHTEVIGAVRSGTGVAGVTVRHRLTGHQRTVHARLVVNAAGPWFDEAAARLVPSPPARVRTTKGVHVACAPFTRHAVVLESAVDGRVVFAIPWGEYTWLGTTDTDFAGDPATAAATPADVDYLLDSIAPYYPVARAAGKYWTTAGVRALVRSRGDESEISRMHRIVADGQGLVAVVGGKITGYRAIAEEVTDAVCGQLRHRRTSQTSTRPLPGGGIERSGDAHLDAIYGGRAGRVRDLAESSGALGARLAPEYPDIAAQVVFGVRHEWCRDVEDFMLRRSYLGFRPDRGVAALAAVSALMQQELGWSAAERGRQVECYRALVARGRLGLAAAASPVHSSGGDDRPSG